MNARRARWMEFLSEFNFEIKHVKGKENMLANVLSRRMHLLIVILCKSDLKGRILKDSSKDEVFLQIEEVVQERNNDGKYVDYKLDEGECLVDKGRLYIPNA